MLAVAELAARVLATPPRLGAVRLVCIDGPAGSGKSTLAGLLATQFDAVVLLHLDDLYEGWSGLSGVWERVEAQVLAPLRRGQPGRYLRYDWVRGSFAEWHDVPPCDVLVLEGCGSAPRAVDDDAVLRVWVEAPAGVRLARGLARDGEALRERWLEWMAAEAAHFAVEATRERADVRVSGDPAPGRDQGREFELLR